MILLTLFFENGCWKVTAEILEKKKLFYILFLSSVVLFIAEHLYSTISKLKFPAGSNLARAMLEICISDCF